MPNNFQSITSGEPELKDYYNQESQYEAIKKRRKRRLQKEGLTEDDTVGYDTVPKPIDEF